MYKIKIVFRIRTVLTSPIMGQRVEWKLTRGIGWVILVRHVGWWNRKMKTFLESKKKANVCFQRHCVQVYIQETREGQVQKGSTNRKASVRMTLGKDDRFLQDHYAPAIVVQKRGPQTRDDVKWMYCAKSPLRQISEERSWGCVFEGVIRFIYRRKDDLMDYLVTK